MMRWLPFAASALLVIGCSSNEDDGGAECAPGVMPGAVATCPCADGVTMGTQSCLANGSYSSCGPCLDTGGGGQGGSGGAPIATGGVGGGGGLGGSGVGGGGSGGSSGIGGSSGVGGSGGSGGLGDEDAGSELPDAGPMPDGGNAPGDGDQNTACPNGNECNSALGCYLNNHCTAQCDNDGDCDGIAGADYTCWAQQGLCRVVCTVDDDCPTGFECQNVGMGMGMTLRCMLP